MAYIPVLLMMLIGTSIGIGILALSHFLGPRLPNPRKNMPFECGVDPIMNAKHRISVRFYLVAILFLLFDVEAIFFYPWAVVFKKYLSINSFILIEMGIFAAIVLIGYFYVLRKGALEWE
ncbi:MAG TPA: NADH-quinone oxidoreductase subunit A [Bdellovibrionales bacterium]|nr:MAG: NADH-quinone oxidoreductase subunit A [Bdellovibrionales bacterium GWB1_52_6]OFZ04451.1 MAG: NADH-quinone oxidoreductase subunit A [Bdellovibrionales bacterium GWA1_52_35]OFZ40551.1 MAG: NADH-quinone oxidoreductase subunit A [Bdellovibrionales bacterium GWC1_52_8]HAR42508.1 NADH-quinone oxidoreductase subunit A [Bdellovibrionales bacterium]HCM40688.1 NADH-quinone oxidoreductase subunit A [Bdellovibrionales bacterium]